jgi:glutathione peroxidase
MNSFFEFKVRSLEGADDLLGPLHGKVVLAVNVASRCGLTPQYAALQELYTELAGQNFVVVGFPCNQFGTQEPGSATQIRSFCDASYGVSFPLSAKLEVNGAARDPLYAWLTAPENGYPGDIGWNFEKFLIDRGGRVSNRYSPRIPPTDAGFLQDLANIL